MDDRPLDLIEKCASSTEETLFSSEKQQGSNIEDIQLYSEKSDLSLVAELSSSSEENNETASEQDSEKYFHSQKINKTLNQTLESPDMMMGSLVKTKRKHSEEHSINPEAKRRRASDSASSSKIGDNSTLPADSDSSEIASTDSISSRPSTSSGTICSYDSTAIQANPFNVSLKLPFVCGHCAKGSRYPSQVAKHTRTHTGEEPFRSESCDKRFYTKSDLQQHTTRLHTAERPYRCEKCKNSVTAIGNLTRHSRRHTGEKLYVCLTCGKAFTRKYHKQEHENTHKNNSKET